MLAIRDAKPADEETFLELMRQVHELHRENRPDIYRPFDPRAMRGAFAELPAGGGGFTLLAVLDGAAAGLCAVRYRQPQENPLLQPQRIAYLEELCIAAAHRGGGIGTRLLEAAKRRAAADGMARLELMVWSFNEGARRFYEKAGMREKCSVMEMELSGR